MPFFPDFAVRELIGWYGALGLLGILAALFPWELGTKADPFAPAPPGIRPEWYFLAVFYTLKLIPSKILIFDGETVGILLFGLCAVGWMLMPFWDRRSAQEERHRLLTGLGVFIVAYLVVFSALGYWR
jgi:quinol-cytochrome oxidoreductase complex cytochrome b subunit